MNSLAFRAWNRGLAVVTTGAPDVTGFTTNFPVWRYNGSSWYPDPAFPGQSVCKGNTILWAGKLDVWLVGDVFTGQPDNWPALCRYDGTLSAWEPLSVPKAALAHVPLQPTGAPDPGAINTGACFAWNNCWFFGSYGVILHWDGNALTDATPNPAAPWLRSDFMAAVAAVDAAGNPFAVAVGGTTADAGQRGLTGEPVTGVQPIPAQPDGSPPPLVVGSTGDAPTPLAFGNPPGFTNPVGTDAFQTDLVAAAFNAQGDGWVAGDARDVRTAAGASSTAEPAPLVPITSTGAPQSCPAGTPGIPTFPGRDNANVSAGPWWIWSSLGVLPTGDAIAGGQASNSTGFRSEPVLVDVSCNGYQVTRFRVLNVSHTALEPADAGGSVTAVAVNATNDAWAATSAGSAPDGPQPAQLYRFTDGQPPNAPAGDDLEPRPLPVQTQPSLFVFPPPVTVPPPPPPTTVTKHTRRKRKVVHLAPAVYRIRIGKPASAAAGEFRLVISFRVRRKVTIGIEGLRAGKVVASSGLRTFRGKSGQLVLLLNRTKWPTHLKFIQPKAKQ